MQENPYPDIPEFESSEKPKINKILYVFIGLILIIVVVYAVVFISARKPACGNGVCEVEENCFDCPKDCKCGEGKICSEEKKICVKIEEKKKRYGNGVCDPGENCWDHPKDCICGEDEYCSKEEKKCVKPVCGNGKCEDYEDSYNCCLDCNCTIPGEVCNKETKKCEMPDINLSDNKAKELVIDYFKNNPDYQGLKIGSINVTGTSVYDKELIKVVMIQIAEEGWYIYFGVTENGKVAELPIM